MLVRGEGAVGLNDDPPVPPPKGGASGREAVAVRKKLWKEQCCGREAVAAAWKELLLWSRTGEPGWPRIPPQGSRGAECETTPASGAEQAGEEGVTENPPSREEPGWETAPASEAVAVDEKLLLRGRSCGRSVAAVAKLLLRPGRSCCCGRGLESQDGPGYRPRGAEESNGRPPQPQEQNKREKRE